MTIYNPFGLNLTEVTEDTVFQTGDEIIYLQSDRYQKYTIDKFEPGTQRFRLNYDGSGNKKKFFLVNEFFGYYEYSSFRRGYYLLNKEVPYDPTQQGDTDDDI